LPAATRCGWRSTPNGVTLSRRAMKVTPKMREDLQKLKRRFEFNIGRVAALRGEFGRLSDKIANDVLRAAVVLLHATLEDALRGFLGVMLPVAKDEALKDIEFNRDLLRPEWTKAISVAQLRKYKDQTVEHYVVHVIKSHLKRQTFNNKRDVLDAILRLDLPPAEFGQQLDTIEEMTKRRHDIVHNSDRVDATDEHYGKRKEIDPLIVEKWHREVDRVLRKIFGMLTAPPPKRKKKRDKKLLGMGKG
jgi:hypothetical protein